MPAKLVEVNIEHGDERVKILAQNLSVGRDKIFTGGKVVFYLFISDAQNIFLLRRFFYCAAKIFKRVRAELRHALAAFISAECGGGYTRERAKLLCRAREDFGVIVKHIAKFHKIIIPFFYESIVHYKT